MIYEGHSNIIYSLQLSQTTNEFYTAGKEGIVYNWKVNSKDSQVFLKQPNPIYMLCLSPDSNYLYVCGKGDIKISKYNTSTKKLEKKFDKGHTDSVFSLAISKNGKTLFSGGADHRILSWNTETGEIENEFLKGHSDCVQFLVLDQDGMNLYSCGRDSQIFRWKTETGTKLKEFEKGHHEWVGGAALTKNGEFFYTCGGDKNIIEWSALDGKVVQVFPKKQKGNIYCLVLSNDDKFLFSGFADGEVLVWNVKNKTVVKRFTGHSNQVRFFGLNQNFEFLLSCGKDKTIRQWDLIFLQTLNRFSKAISSQEIDTANQIIESQLEKNNNINEIHEIQSISGSLDEATQQKLKNKILQLYQENLQELQESPNKIIEENLIDLLEKCYFTSSQHNQLLNIIRNNNYNETTLQNSFDQIKQEQKELQELKQFRQESQEKIHHLQKILQDKEFEPEQNQKLDDVYKYIQLEDKKIFQKFEGTIINGLKEGNVKETNYENEVFEGKYEKGKREGPGFLKNKQFSFEGLFENNRPVFQTGKITHFDEDENHFEKQFKNILNYTGEFQDKIIHGKGVIYFRNLGAYQGEFQQDEIDGSIIGKLILLNDKKELVSENCSYGFFKSQNIGRFTTLNKTYDCDFEKGELVQSEDNNKEQFN